MATSWLSNLFAVPETPGPPASLVVLTPQPTKIPTSPPPTPPQLGEERRTQSVF